jgi:NAD(P)-dependent dehydrogenase (short-subunit alcohol dehydrogenase family)
MKISNHLYVVTGASSGLGLSTSTLLHSQGAYLALLDLNKQQGERLVKDLGGDRVKFWECDVGDEESVDNTFESINQWINSKQDINIKWGGVVHAGGVGMVGKTISNKTFEPFNFETFKEIHRINLHGSFLICSRTASMIAKQNNNDSVDLSKPENAAQEEENGDRGVIILVSSVSATEGQMGQLAYASSKAAVEGLVLPMSRDLARYGESTFSSSKGGKSMS